MPVIPKRTYPRDRNTGRFLFPGTNYLGPGNSLDGAPPTSKVDRAAYLHDIDPRFKYFYHNPADEDFIRRVKKVKPSSWSERAQKSVALGWHSLKKNFFPHTESLKRKRAPSTPYDQYALESLRPAKKLMATRTTRTMRGRRPRIRRRRVLRRRTFRKRPIRRKTLRKLRSYRRKRLSKKQPVIMNQVVGIKYKKMRPFIPKVAACKIKTTWTKNIFVRAGTYGTYYPWTAENPDSAAAGQLAYYSNQGHVHDTNGNEIPDAMTYGYHYSTPRLKIAQTFRTGQLNSVASEPRITTSGGVSRVLHKTNPIMNGWNLESKPGYPHELMTRMYNKVRVCANKYTIKLSINGGPNYKLDELQRNRFVVQYGLYWIKGRSLSTDPQDPDNTLTYPKQFAREVLNKNFEQLRMQPGVKTMFLNKKPRYIKMFIPTERIANKRFEDQWKWQTESTTGDYNYVSTRSTVPTYTTTGVTGFDDGSAYTVTVPYYPWTVHNEEVFPYFWILIHDTNRTNKADPISTALPSASGQFSIQANVKETKYNVYSDPLFNLRSQQWTEGKELLTGLYKFLPENARIFPTDVHHFAHRQGTGDNVGEKIADETGVTVGVHGLTALNAIVTNNNRNDMSMDTNALIH